MTRKPETHAKKRKFAISLSLKLKNRFQKGSLVSLNNLSGRICCKFCKTRLKNVLMTASKKKEEGGRKKTMCARRKLIVGKFIDT